MIKRNDLATQFSLVVQQEIKNHNNAVTACNAALEAIKSRCVDIQADHRKHEALVDSKLTLLQIERKEMIRSLDDLSRESDRKFNDADARFYKMSEQLADMKSKISQLETTVRDFISEMSAVRQMIGCVSNECVGIVTAIKQDLSMHQSRSSDNLYKLEQSLLARPCEDHEHRKHMEGKLCSYDLTIDHMKEHIDHISNKAFYQQKQIEALRDTIKRQEKGK